MVTDQQIFYTHPHTYTDSGAAAAMTIVGMKLIRSAYTELSRQHLVFIFTLLFFSFDYAHLSEGLPLDYFIIAILMNKVREGRGRGHFQKNC